MGDTLTVDEAVERLMDLDTVDINDVEIFSSGGPYFGQGSPKAGDTYSKDDVAALASTTEEAVSGGKMRSVIKIGHSAAQKLAKTLGLSDDELPALGLQENFRVSDDGKVLADWKKVPKLLAEQIVAGRWPTRSVELVNRTIDGEKKLVFGATSLLGAKPPAVGSLAEITALHSEDEEPVRAFALSFAPDPEATEGIADAADRTEDVLEALKDREEAFERHLSEARAMMDQVLARFSDTSDVTTKTKTLPEFDDTKVEQFAAAFGIEESDTDKRREAVAAKFAETVKETPDDDNGGTGGGTDGGEGGEGGEGTTPPAAAAALPAGTVAMSAAEVEVLRAGAQAGTAAAEQLRKERVDRKLSDAIKDGRLDPAKREQWETWFASNEEQTAEMLSELPVNEELLKTYGSDAPQPLTDEDAMSDAVMRMFGLDEYIETGSAA